MISEPFIKQQDIRSQKNKRIAYSYFFLQGTISLLGYNAILGSLDYFHQKFNDYNIYFYLPLPPMISFNIISILMPKIVQLISYQIRILICILAMILILIFLPITAFYMSDSAQGFALLMSLAFIWGIFGQIFNSSSVGLACSMGDKYIVYYNTGSSFSGIVITVTRIISVLSYKEDINVSTFEYFITACFVNVVGIFVHFFFIKNDIYKDFESHRLIQEIQQEKETTNKLFKNYFDTFMYVFTLILFMFLSNVQANMVYPAIVLSSPLKGVSGTWSSLWIVFMHNVSNAIGKMFTIFRKLFNNKLIYAIIIGRCLQCAIFVINYIQKQDSVFYDNYILCINITLFSFLCGFTDSALFVLSAEVCKGNQKKQQAGFLMAFSLTVGIMVGVFLALPFTKI